MSKQNTHKHLGTGELFLLLSIHSNNNIANVKQITYILKEKTQFDYKPAHLYTSIGRLIDKGMVEECNESSVRTFSLSEKGKDELYQLLNFISNFGVSYA